MILNEIISIIRDSRHIAILPHVSADGDALGSCFALGLALRRLGKDVHVYLEEEVPYVYSFLPGQEAAKVYPVETIKNHDVIIALDTGDLGRLGKRADIFGSSPVTVNIDHHATNSAFAGYNHVDTASAAVGEIIYQMLMLMGVKMDKDISTCLYVAIAADTGGFRFSNTTSVTHRIAGDLINNGIDVADISRKVFDSTSLAKVQLMGLAIHSLELLENGKVAVITVTEEMMQQSGAADEDCDGLVNIGRNIRGVEVAVLIKQKGSEEFRINLRSNTYVDVSAIAARFSGGGHRRAAGCTLQGTWKDAGSRLLAQIRDVL
jgi:bifunctional oligoribonuclease and PAP phosphatase NrnA